MPDTTRTFVALPLPGKIAEGLGRLRARLEPDTPGARWIETRNLHVTLAFLGDVAAADLAGVCAAAAEAAAPIDPFELTVEGLGAFPGPVRPRVLWAGLTGPGVEALRELQRAVADAMRGAGYPPDNRFDPHVTLARFKPGRGTRTDLSPILGRQRGQPTAFRATEIVVSGSRLTPDGPEYTALARGALKGGKPGI
jgi:2'-5' RNA ligase